MAKRFIDTGIFDDPWFMDLSKDAKLFWMYCITKCNHAGIIEINAMLCKFQTGIDSIETVIKLLGDRLLRVNETTFFIPKFIYFQYPGFPKSAVRQQYSAIEILCKYGLYDKELNSLLTLNKELPNSYGNDNDNGNGNVSGNVINIPFEKFWNLYDKKTGRDKCEKKWNNIADADREKIIETLPKYLATITDKKYQKNPLTYLNGKHWNDEIVQNKKTEFVNPFIKLLHECEQGTV